MCCSNTAGGTGRALAALLLTGLFHVGAIAQANLETSSVKELRSAYVGRTVEVEDSYDYGAKLAFYREWALGLTADKPPRLALLKLLRDRRKFDATLTLGRSHFDAPDDRYSGRLKMAMTYYFSDRGQEAKNFAEQVASDAKAESLGTGFFSGPGANSPYRTISAWLALAGANEIKARVADRDKHYEELGSVIDEGVMASRRALEIASTLPRTDDSMAAIFHSKEELASLLLQRIRLMLEEKNEPNALRTLTEYLTLSTEVANHPIFFADIALAKYEEKQFREAEKLFRKADERANTFGYRTLSPFRSECAQGTIGSLEGQQDWAGANIELSRVDALAERDATLQYRVRFRFERGLAYLFAGRLEEALKLFSEFQEHSNSGLDRAHALGLKGVVLWRMGEKAGALALLKQAVSIYLKPLYLDDQTIGLNPMVRAQVVGFYLDAVFQTPGEDLTQALAPAEWVNNSEVQAAVSDAAVRAATRVPALASLVRKEQDLKQEIRSLKSRASLEASPGTEERINELNIERLEVLGHIESRFPNYKNLVAPAPLDSRTAAALLRPDELFVAIIPAEENVFVWAISASGANTSMRVAMPFAKLAKLVKGIRQSVDFANMGETVTPFDSQSAYALYQSLLQPLNTVFSGKKHLIVAATGPLGQIPFALLPTALAGAESAKASWLIGQIAISHVSSLTSWVTLKKLAQTPSAVEPFRGWGDPQFGPDPTVVTAKSTSQKWVRKLWSGRAVAGDSGAAEGREKTFDYAKVPALPETREELLAIAATLGADPAQDLLLGAAASKASVIDSSESGELVKKRVVAFATHGLMADDLPGLTQPALALARNSAIDRDPLGALLTLDEVLNLKLNADWVVLSACNTAAPDGKVDEALSGLARGFFYAGSRSLLVTQWAVESESAKLLTTHTMKFYVENLTQRKAESLRQAMLTVMAIPGYQHPAYWAPYTLVGDGGR